jgi:hypothetical protein
MSDDTPRLKLGQLVDGQEMDAMTINEALIQLDTLTDACFKDQFSNTPPAAPADGDTYLLGAAPTGAWSGYAYKIAYCLDGGWRFTTPFDGMRAWVASNSAFIFYQGGNWVAFNPALSVNEVAIASAATCDIGGAGSMCVAITGSAAITGFGKGANCLRFLRFAAALTLTYNATSLVTPTGANIQAAPGDCCIARSDASGNWRIIDYLPAGGIVAAAVGPLTAGGGTAVTAMGSISIPPGRWRLSAQVQYYGGNSSNSFTRAELSTANGAFIGTRGFNQVYFANDTSAQVGAGVIGPFDVTLSTAATYYLNVSHRAASDSCSGSLRAERIV